MKEEVEAVLVVDLPELLEPLQRGLESQRVKTLSVRTCLELARTLSGAHLPHLVFTEAALPDGTWKDVIELAAVVPEAVNVIVVSRIVDTRLYMEVLEGGAFDFITTPLALSELTHVIRCAADNAILRRQGSARHEESSEGTLLPSSPQLGRRRRRQGMTA